MRRICTILLCLMPFWLQAQINTFPYVEDFETGPAGWVAGGTASSWGLVDPALAVINSAASGDSAWVTALGTGGGTGGYNVNEASFVQSPQFDLTSLASPIVRMNVWWNSEFSWDGAVLQTSVDTGQTWQNVGVFGDPNNWYTDNSINGAPGLSQDGWTGRGVTGSGGWVTAEHALTGLAGVPHVFLRVAFGSDASVLDDGFGFDDVSVFDPPNIEVAGLGIPRPTSGCGLTATDTVAVMYTNAGAMSVDSTSVSYQVNGGTVVTEIDTSTLQPGDTAIYVFTTTANFSVLGPYTIDAWVFKAGDPLPQNDSTPTKMIDNFPSLSTFPYLENFESGPGGWSSGGVINDWQLGTPNGFNIIGANSGVNAWITDTANIYSNSHDGFVISPCFDMTTLNKPIVRLDIWWDAEFSWDGAVLQSSTDAGVTWADIGMNGDPDNWYNDNTINGLVNAGESGHGWTGDNNNVGSGAWLSARQDVPQLAGEGSVRFRILYGSDGSVNAGRDGFAFDDFEIFNAPAQDAHALELLRPVSGCALSASDTVEVMYYNRGSASWNNAMLSYSVNGAAAVTETDTTTLAPGDTTIYKFVTAVNLSGIASYTIDVWIDLLGDPDPTNDSLLNNLAVHKPSISSFPYIQNFDGPAWVPDNATFSPGVPIIAVGPGWENVQEKTFNTPQDWAIRSAATGSFGTGPDFDHTTGSSNYVFVEDNFENDSVMLVTPCFDISGLLNPELQFWVHSNNNNDPDDENELHIDIFLNGQWSQDIVAPIKHRNNSWNQVILSLVPYISAGDVAFRFRVNNNNPAGFGGHDIAIDDFVVTEILPHDMGVSAFFSPVSGCGLSATQPIDIELTNYGVLAQDSIEVAYSVNNGTPVVETVFFSPSLPGGATFSYTLTNPVNLSVPGAYNIVVYTQNLAGDTNIGNDTTISDVLHKVPITSFPYLETFEDSASFPPNNGFTAIGTPVIALGMDWENSQKDDLEDWTPRQTATGSGGTGPNADHTSGSGTYLFVEDSGFDNDSVVLITPCYDISALANPEMRFWVHSNSPTGTNTLHIDAIYQGNVIYDIQPPIGNRGGNWVQDSIDLSVFPGVVGFRFRVNNNNGNINHDIAIDDIEILDVLANDIGAIRVINPSAGLCGDSMQSIDVVIYNFGSEAQFNFPVRASVNGGAPITVMYTDTLFSAQSDIVNLGMFNTYAGGTFDVTAYTDLVSDQARANDTTSKTGITIIAIPPAPVAFSDTSCGPDSFLLSVVPNPGSVSYWWDANAGGNNVAQGDTFNTTFLGTTTNYWVSQSAFSADTLNTPFDQNNGSSGNMFDIFAKNALQIDSFDVATASTATQLAEIYYTTTANTYVGNETNAAAWTLLGSAMITGAGTGTLTTVPVGGLNIPSGTSIGIYVSLISIQYTTLPANDTISNADMEVRRGIGLGASFGSVFSPRGWNGRVYYSSPGCESERTLVPAVIASPLALDLGPDGAACAGVTIDATTLGAVSYMWNNGLTTPAIQVTTSGQYFVTATNADGCTAIDTINLLIQPSPMVNLGPDATVCGDTLLDAGNPGASYAWSNGSFNQTLLVTSSGTYSVQTTNVQGCTDTDTITVTVLPSPSVDLGPDVSPCESATLDAGVGATSYLWSNMATTQTITVTTSGLYSVTATGANGCADTDDIVVNILPNPVVNLGADTTFCGVGILDAGNPGATYAWTGGSSGQTLSVTTTGNYIVDVTDANGCMASDTAAVTVEPIPMADFSWIFTSPATVKLTNASTPGPGPGISYLWDFGDMNTSTMENPTHTYAIVGNYQITLTITSAACGDSDVTKVGATAIDELFDASIQLFPNPNTGRFKVMIEGLAAEDLEIRVTDIAGKVVYKHKEGRYNGSYQHEVDLASKAEGVYLIRISDGERTSMKKVVLER